MSASPNRIVSKANRSDRIVRKVESPPARQGGERAQRGGEADDQHHAVLLVRPDDEGEGGEDGEAQHAHRADTLAGGIGKSAH